MTEDTNGPSLIPEAIPLEASLRGKVYAVTGGSSGIVSYPLHLSTRAMSSTPESRTGKTTLWRGNLIAHKCWQWKKT